MPNPVSRLATALAEPVVELGQLQLNVVDEHGVEWWLGDVEGWDSPASSTEATQRSGADGAWLTAPFLAARTVEITGHAIAPSRAECRNAADQLAAAVGLADFRIVVHEFGLSRYATVRRSGEVLWDYLNATTAAWSVSLVAGDPHRYAVDAHTATVRLAQERGGVTVPLRAPFAVAANVSPNNTLVTNAGNASAQPVFRIHGPASDPTLLLHRTDGEAVVEQMRFAISLDPGHQLVVRTADRSVLLDDQASRLHTMTGSWLRFPPGTSTLTYVAASTDPESRVVVRWRDTYL